MKEIVCKKCSADDSNLLIEANDNNQFIFRCKVCNDITLMDIGERAFYGLMADILQKDTETLNFIPKKQLLDELTESIEKRKKGSKE